MNGRTTVDSGARVAGLLLAAGVGACAALPPSSPAPAPAALPPAECHAPVNASLAQYVVGYGSLMEDGSRARSSPHASPAHPVEVEGFRRGWFARGSSVGFSTTYLGAVTDPAGHFNAVAYRLDLAELAATDRREQSYCRVRVPDAALRSLDPAFALPAGVPVWIYVNRPESVAPPDARYPIVESYVDIFLSGCLEQEERFHLAGFASRCVATTGDWSEHWLNDRLYPRRPFIYQPRAQQIDTLLNDAIPEYFGKIRIEGGS